MLSAIFYAFEEHPGKGVNVAEIAGGLSLLCSGNKSSKLAVSAAEVLTLLEFLVHCHSCAPELSLFGLWNGCALSTVRERTGRICRRDRRRCFSHKGCVRVRRYRTDHGP